MGTNFGEELMSRMAELHAELTELPDTEKSYMEGFFRGRAEGLAIGQEEGEFTERERIINLFISVWNTSWSVSSREELEAFIKGENK
jgi:hypothetical protein